VRAPGAGRVELVGDFTDWDPLALQRTRGDTWEITLPLASGTHRLNVRVDGGEWGVPPGISAAPDEFGGVVGLLLIS
jgi:1,4-alpha-glucan branching enzyme